MKLPPLGVIRRVEFFGFLVLGVTASDEPVGAAARSLHTRGFIRSIFDLR